MTMFRIAHPQYLGCKQVSSCFLDDNILIDNDESFLDSTVGLVFEKVSNWSLVCGAGNEDQMQQPKQQTRTHQGSNTGHYFRTNISICFRPRRTCLQRKVCPYRSLRLEIGFARLQVCVGWSGTIDTTHQPRARLLRCRTKVVYIK